MRYRTHEAAALSGSSGIDLYYLGLRNQRATFSAQTAAELRHSIGARVFGVSEARDWNIEGAWQWGSFGASHIRAWTLSSDIGYTLAAWPLAPRLGFKADIISGDRDPHDTTLGTFNPMFPRLDYFSAANVAVPANLYDIQPSVSLQVTNSLRLNGSWNVLWRYSRNDTLYLPPLKSVTTLSGISGRYLGQQWSSTLDWRLLPRVTFASGFVSFMPGASLRQAGGASGKFFFASLQVVF